METTLNPAHDPFIESIMRSLGIYKRFSPDGIPPGVLMTPRVNTKKMRIRIIRLNPKCYINWEIFEGRQKITVLSGKVVLRPKRGLEYNLNKGESFEGYSDFGKIISQSEKNTFLIVKEYK